MTDSKQRIDGHCITKDASKRYYYFHFIKQLEGDLKSLIEEYNLRNVYSKYSINGREDLFDIKIEKRRNKNLELVESIDKYLSIIGKFKVLLQEEEEEEEERRQQEIEEEEEKERKKQRLDDTKESVKSNYINELW